MKRNEDVIIVDNTDDKSVKDSIIDNKTIDKNCLFRFPFSYQIEDVMHTISYNDKEDDTLTLGMREARGQVYKFIQNSVVWEDANKKIPKYSTLNTQDNYCFETIINDDKQRLLAIDFDGYFNDTIINFWMLW